MRLLNDKGQLFGKLSVLDLLVVAVVLGLAAGFILKRLPGEIKQIINADSRFYVTFKGDQLRGFSTGNVGEGDIFFRQYDGQPLGEVVQVDVGPGVDILMKSDGTAMLAEMEERYTLYITLLCSGSVTEAGYFINGYMHVAEGSEMMIHSNRLIVNTGVFRIAETPYLP